MKEQLTGYSKIKLQVLSMNPFVNEKSHEASWSTELKTLSGASQQNSVTAFS